MHEATQITYGNGVVNIIMNSESLTEVSAPDIRFGDYKQTLKTCFTPKELESIENGATAELNFGFTMTDELEDSDETGVFNMAIARTSGKYGSMEKGVYFQVVATKAVDGAEPEPLEAFYGDMEYQIQIPLFLVKEGRSYYAMTNDIGECTLEDDMDEAADTLTISTDDIGTTLILYQDGELEKDSDKSIKMNGSYLILTGLLALGIVWLSVDRMHKKQ